MGLEEELPPVLDPALLLPTDAETETPVRLAAVRVKLELPASC